ncbi:MAG TPA: LptF/LptG family permease [Gemmatimonadaceae bacterium]|nr:LptF/LptG family permease [Gemmatimonadaceae bacterium]
MKILHKYVLKEHLGPLMFAMTALTSLLLLQYIAKRFGELVGKGLPWSVIVEFLMLSLPLTIALSLPMAVLVSTLYAFSRVAAENEITAMKASGVSLRNVLTPVLWAAAGVTLFMLGFNDQVLPRANHKLRSLQGDIAQKKPTFALREQVINEVSPGKLYLRAGRLSQTSNSMRDITIYDMGDPGRRRTIYADSGTMAMSPNQADLQLTLYSGSVLDVPTNAPQQLQRLYFKTQLTRVAGVGNAFQKTENDNFKGEREMSICEMERNAKEARGRFAEAKKEFREKVALARKRKVKLDQEVLATKTTLPIDIGLGGAYCALLSRLGVKELVAQTPAKPTPVQDTITDSVKARTDSARKGIDSAAAISGPVVPQVDSPVRPVTPPASIRVKPPITMAGPSVPAMPLDARGNLTNPNLRQSATYSPLPSGEVVPVEIIPGQIEGARLRVMDTMRSINRYDVEIQKKFALAGACFIFVLLGAPIALRFPRAGVGLTIGVSLVVFGLYYVGLIAGESLARRGMVPPFVSMWIANAVFFALALILLANMGKESGSSRGADFGEILDNLRYRLRRGPVRVAARVNPGPSSS